MTHTMTGRVGWWKVTLTEPSYISHIDVYNRMDGAQERLQGAEVSVDGTVVGTVEQRNRVQMYQFLVHRFGKSRTTELINTFQNQIFFTQNTLLNTINTGSEWVVCCGFAR